MPLDSWFLLRDDTAYDRVLLTGPADAYTMVIEGATAAGLQQLRIERGGRPVGLTMEAPPPVAARLCAAPRAATDPTKIPVILEAWTALDDPRAPVGAFVYLDFGASNVDPTPVPTASGVRPLTLIGRAVRLAAARQYPGALQDEANAMLTRLLEHGPMTVPDQLLAHLDGEPPRHD